MLTDKLDQFLEVALGEPDHPGPNTMRAAKLVVDPDFKVHPETSDDNLYVETGAKVDISRAREQHHALTETLHACGIPVISFPALPDAPDGVFPNNAFATTAHRRLIIGAMKHPVRQQETQRGDVRNFFEEAMGYEVVDLSEAALTAELTGTLVIDHHRYIGFLGMSQRVCDEGAEALHDAFGLRATLMFALGSEEYHTNVVMSVLAGRACVYHPGSLTPEAVDALDKIYDHAAFRLSDHEKNAFVGNCIAATEEDVLMSLTAWSALSEEARAFFDRQRFRLRPVDVSEFEKAGGSLRCMVAEVF